ncbi:MAG: glycosyltransferase family 9 protein [Myxococcota bacterium]|nr:glycosyltransferase family 9 protein [Myxococcota bacterium]
MRTLPAVSSLRAGLPGVHLAWLVEPRSAGAVEGQPWVDEVLVFPRPQLVGDLRAGRPIAAWRRFCSFASRLRSRRFDLVLDFHSLARSALLARLSGAPRRLGYARPFGRELSWLLATHRARLSPRRISRFERNALLVRYLGVEAPQSRRPFRVPAIALEQFRQELGTGAAPVALHPGSSDGTARKRWDPARFAQLARLFRDREGIPSVVTWGPARDDRSVAEAVVVGSGGAARLAPRTADVGALGALLACCRLYVGGDTGPLHVASLVGTPVVQLLGATNRIENAPWPETPARSVWSGEGMDMSPESVFEAGRALLGGGAPEISGDGA